MAGVSVLLDTCALLSLADGDLPRHATAALKTAPEAFVSVVSPWEVAIKVAAGKLTLKESPLDWFLGLVERYDLRELQLDAGVACAATGLPAFHRDPFDRVIVATALARGLTVLTSDQHIRGYPGITSTW